MLFSRRPGIAPGWGESALPSQSEPRPILVTGSHRSGSTWVGRVLAATPGIGYIHEPVSPLCPPGICSAKFPHWFFKLTNENAEPYESALRDCMKFSYQWHAQLGAIGGAKDLARTLRDGARFAAWRLRGANPLVKDPIALFSAPWLARRFDMRVVVLVRHPAAFVASLIAADWHFPFADLLAQDSLMHNELAAYGGDIAEHAARPRPLLEQGILLWNLFHDLVDRWRAVYPDWIFVRHEDLSRDPLGEFSSLCDRLELEFERGIQQAVERSAFSNKEGRLARDSRSNVWSWRKRLNPDEVAHVRKDTGLVWPQFYTEEDWIPRD